MARENLYIKAVSLLELSVVLIVISLVATVITVGGTMIKNAKILQVVTQVQEYETAIQSFRLAFQSYPGDFDDADSSFNAECRKVGLAASCSGDGDGVIEESLNEDLLAWTHLAGHGLIGGTHYGQVFSASQKSEPGYNVPEINFRYGGIAFTSTQSTQSTQASVQDKSSINGWEGYMLLIAAPDAENGEMYMGSLTDREAKDIDDKIDDGFASSGFFMGINAVRLVDTDECLDSGEYALRIRATEGTRAACTGVFWIDRFKG